MKSSSIHLFDKTPSIGLLKVVDWKISNRIHLKEEGILEALNCSIIIDCTAYIEGFVNLYLVEYLNQHYSNLENKGIYQHFIDEINKSSFQNTIELYKLLTENDFKLITIENIYRGITVLFQLRNIIVHGNEIGFNKLTTGNRTEIKLTEKKHDNIYNYFKEVKILNRYYDEKSDINMFLTDTMTDHLVLITKNFANDFKKHASDNNVDLVVGYLEYYD